MTEHESPSETKSQQINAAINQRAAARDYYELSSPRSIKLALATWPTEKLNDLALDNSRMFAYRFGFEASTTVRQQVIDIQKQLDLTDREMRCLRRSGQLVIQASKAELKPSRLALIAGWVLLIMLGIFCVSMTPAVIYAHAPDWSLALGQVILVAMCLSVTWIITSLFLLPWQILKRAGALNPARPS